MGGAASAHLRDIMKRILSFFTCAVAFAACGGVTTNLGNDSTDTVGGDAGDLRDGSVNNTPDAQTNDSADIDAGSFGCGKVGGDPPPPFGSCPPNLYCDQGAGKCHTRGTCKPITAPPSTGCTALVPVCGCDGKDYCDADDAQRNGTVVAMAGGCKIECGGQQCNGLVEYCEHGSGGIPLPDGGAFEQYTCKTYPVSCYDKDDRSCECLKAANVPMGACMTNGGHVRVEQFFP